MVEIKVTNVSTRGRVIWCRDIESGLGMMYNVVDSLDEPPAPG